MTIKKLADKEVSLDTQSTAVKVSYVDSFKLTIGESLIDKPGEYEINNIAVMALEVPNPDYVVVSDFVAIHSEGIDVGFLFGEKGANKEYLKDVANIDILVVTPDLNVENVKRVITLFEPQYLVILGSKNIEEVTKAYNYPNFAEEKTLKVKDTDFPRGENIVVRPVILK